MKDLKKFIATTIREYLNENRIVYRGIPKNKLDISPNKHIWVSDDEDFANIYGGDNRIIKFNIPKTLNIVDINAHYYLLDNFSDENDFDEPDDLMYDPTNEFIKFLKDKEYDGFQNDDNILIFDKTKIEQIM